MLQGTKATLIMVFLLLSTPPVTLDNTVQTLSSPPMPTSALPLATPNMKSLKRGLRLWKTIQYICHPDRLYPSNHSWQTTLLCWFRKGVMPGSPDCPPSTGCSTVLLAREACDSGDLAEDEQRTLIMLVKDNKTTHNGFITGLCHIAAAFCFLPITWLLLNSSRTSLGSDSRWQCTYIMPSWCLNRGLSST